MKKLTLISKGFLGTTCLASMLGYGLTANAADLTPVTLELALLIDGSDSISDQDFYGQLDALNNIFNDPNFYNQYVLPLKGLDVQDPTSSNPGDRVVIDDPSVAVSIFQFGSAVDPISGNGGAPIFEQIVDWTVFNEQHQSGIGSFNPTSINKAGGMTPIADVLLMMVDELSNNAYDGDQVVNLSSDGFDTFSSVSLARTTKDFVFGNNVTFNALAIPATIDGTQEIGTHNSNELYNLSNLEMIVDRVPDMPSDWKKKNLTGNSAFVMTDYATGDKTIEEAFRLKLGLETIGTPPPEPPKPDPDSEQVPEPSSLLGLLMMGLFGLLHRNKKS